MKVKSPNCALALIVVSVYCLSLSIPGLNTFTQVAQPLVAQQQCGIPSGSDGCVAITKTVVAQSGISIGDIAFTIILNDNQGDLVQSKIARNGETVTFTVPQAQYTISEVADPAVGFRVGFSGDCVGGVVDITAGNSISCTITNTLNGAVVDAQAGTQTSNPSVASGLVTGRSIDAQAGTSTGAGETLGIINPPFDVCFGNFLVNTGTAQAPVFRNVPGTSPTLTVGSNNADAPDLIRAPNSATYTAGGTIDLDDVAQALDKFGTRIITIQIYSDFLDHDPVGLADSAPQFKGLIVVEDSEGVKHEVVNFNLYTIRTECKYITFAKAVGDAPNRNVFPLGVVGENDDTSLSEINEILVMQKSRLVTAIEQGAPPVLNPPFATCDVLRRTVANSQEIQTSEDDFGIYSIRGEIDELGSLYGNDLHMELTVDLNIHKRDLAKITANNNPYARVNLIADEDKDSAHKVPFTMHDLWTDCKDLSLNNDLLFDPIQSEITP